MSGNTSVTPRLTRPTGDVYDDPERVPNLGIGEPPADSPIQSYGDTIDTSDTTDWNPVTEPLDQEKINQLNQVLTDVAEGLADDLELPFPDSLRQRLIEWCDLHGFDSPEDPSTVEIITQQAVFNILLKATLYEWYHKRGDLPPLTGDIRERFRHAKNETEDDAFDEYVLDEVTWHADPDTLAPIIDSRTTLFSSGRPAEDIGKLYKAVIPSEQRKTLGQFRTPIEIADVMRRWADTDADILLDPGMGPAALSSPGYPDIIISTDPDDVRGIDRSQLARLMGTVTLTLVGQAHDTRTADFFDLDPDDIASDRVAIVMNPPYTNYSALSDGYQTSLNEQAERETGRSIPGKTPLYGYFLYHARQFLTPGDRLAAIAPQGFLDSRYGTTLKQYLLDTFNIRALVVFDPTNESVFDDAEVTAMLLFLEAKDSDEPGGTTRFIHVRDPDADTDAWQQALRSEESRDTEWGHVMHIDQATLEAGEDWRHRVNPLSIETTHLTPLSDIADVKRGISTGANEFFCLTQSTVNKYELEDEYLAPLIKRVSSIEGYEYTWDDWEAHRDAGRAVWLLYLDALDGVPDTLQEAKQTRDQLATDRSNHTSQDSDSPSANLIAYLQANIADLDFTSKSSPWYRVDRRDPPPILVQAYARNGFNVVLNRTEAVTLNNGHCVYPDAGLTTADIKALVAFLNSTPGAEILRHHADVKSSGAYRIQSGDLKDVEVIDPRSLDPAVVDKLAVLFEKLVAAVGDATEDAIRERIDDTLETHVL